MDNIHATVWSQHDSPRLRYVLDWLLVERLGLSYQLTHDKTEAAAAQHCLAYGWIDGLPSIHETSLLWETGIKPHTIRCAEWQGLYALYYDEASPCDIQFDMFAGIFYLLTRYEEYHTFAPDRHGRYPSQASILFPVLERPVVDEWIEALRLFLEQVWNVAIPRKPFSFQPTYDIDIAWSYRFKGLKRTLGGLLKAGVSFNWQNVGERIDVLRGAKLDPYDSFIWMLMQHMEGTPRPVYFILAALKHARFDKNISPKHPRMASLIRALSESGTPGLHPSYDATQSRMKEEKTMLQSIAGNTITHSRQHYIRLRFPFTYNMLLGCGITNDWSMGYSTHPGFRAGTSHSFRWYRLPIDPEISADEEGTTTLRIHPFCFMDTTVHYDLGLSPESSFERLRIMADRLIQAGGSLVTIMHNFSLGTDAGWQGWRREYEKFLRDVAAY